jgi:histidinol-phosphate/aromatic aminotransferase/cobyric acid decarboxylase-like protein
VKYNHIKYKTFDYVDSIYRKKKTSEIRFNKFRFDRQERISPFPKKILELIHKKFKSEHITCYPELNNLYKKFSKSLNIKENNILFTQGSDLAIKLCFELLIKKKIM